MKILLAICCVIFLTAAAVVRTTISSLPQITTPSTNTYFEVADMSATPKSRKLAIGDLKTAVNPTNLTLSVNGTNTTTPNLQDSASVTWSKSASNLTAKASTTVSVNATNTTTPNFQDSATVTWSKSGSNLTATAAGGGGASTWGPNATLSYSGATNVTMDASGGTNFVVNVTNTTFMAAPSNPPGSTSTNTTWTVTFKMNSTGGYAVTWTNLFKFPGGTAFQPATNANAVSMLTITTSPYTNGQYYADYGILGIQ